MPYTDVQIEDFSKMLTFDFDQFENKDDVGFEADDSHIIFQIKVSKGEAMIENDLNKLADKYKTVEIKKK